MKVYITKADGTGKCAFETLDAALNDIREGIEEGVEYYHLEVREMTKQAFDSLREFES